MKRKEEKDRCAGASQMTQNKNFDLNFIAEIHLRPTITGFGQCAISADGSEKVTWRAPQLWRRFDSVWLLALAPLAATVLTTGARK